MVAVSKKNGSVRICVDLKRLNKYVLREFHPLPKVDEILAQVQGACLFTKLDANSVFYADSIGRPVSAVDNIHYS